MNLLFSPTDLLRVKQDWIDWWDGTIEHPFFGFFARRWFDLIQIFD